MRRQRTSRRRRVQIAEFKTHPAKVTRMARMRGGVEVYEGDRYVMRLLIPSTPLPD
jgi:hypothetical protein